MSDDRCSLSQTYEVPQTLGDLLRLKGRLPSVEGQTSSVRVRPPRPSLHTETRSQRGKHFTLIVEDGSYENPFVRPCRVRKSVRHPNGGVSPETKSLVCGPIWEIVKIK